MADTENKLENRYTVECREQAGRYREQGEGWQIHRTSQRIDTRQNVGEDWKVQRTRQRIDTQQNLGKRLADTENKLENRYAVECRVQASRYREQAREQIHGRMKEVVFAITVEGGPRK